MKSPINHYLASHGLATLADPRALFAQLAMGITSHEKFRSVLMRVHPSERQNCYCALAPRLGFPAKSLLTYEIEAKRVAEEKQYAIKDDEAPGGYRDFRPPEVHTRKKRTVKRVLAKNVGGMICRFCTKEEEFEGDTLVDAVIAARDSGWRWDQLTQSNVCPKCSKARGLDKVQ